MSLSSPNRGGPPSGGPPPPFPGPAGALNRRAWLAGTAGLGVLWAAGARLGAQEATPPPAPRERTVEERYPELRHINLAGNENPFGPSPAVSQAVFRAVAQSCRYPWREERILREDIASLEGVAPENIVLGHGCDEILALAGTIFGHPGANVVSSRPTYLWLMETAEHHGAEIRWVDVDPAYRVDLEGLARAVDHATTCVHLCNPDTPFGTMHPPAAIAAFVRETARRTAVFLDEVYLELRDDFAAQTQVELVRQGLPVIIGRSFSKMHALAGHRVGYAVTTRELAAALERPKMSSLNFLGVAAARASLRDTAFHARSRRLLREGREALAAFLGELGLEHVPSEGNFVMHRLPDALPLPLFSARLRDEFGVLVGRAFPPFETHWCRLSVGTPAEMEAARRGYRALLGPG